MNSNYIVMILKKILVLSFAASMLAACSKNSPTGTTPDTTATTHVTDTGTVPQYGTPLYDTGIFYPGVQVGKITNVVMSSASGMGASRYYTGMLWIENDQGGGTNNIYLVDSTGTERAAFSVTGATDRDWTDMSMGPGPGADTTYIYLADIGNSNAVSRYNYIYRFPEPQTPLGSGVLTGATAPATKITFLYPDGPRDAETILLDPVSKDIYIVDKLGASNVYELPYPQSTDTVIMATKIIQAMPIPAGPLRSGGIASGRTGIIMKTYTSAFYWTITPGESIFSALLNTPVQIPVPGEIQGEAMCFTPNDAAFWTTSKFSTDTYAPLDRCTRR